MKSDVLIQIEEQVTLGNIISHKHPAWRYDFSKSNSREIENQYPTMHQSRL